MQACPLVPVVRAAWGNQPCCNRQNQLKLKLLLQFASAQVKILIGAADVRIN